MTGTVSTDGLQTRAGEAIELTPWCYLTEVDFADTAPNPTGDLNLRGVNFAQAMRELGFVSPELHLYEFMLVGQNFHTSTPLRRLAILFMGADGTIATIPGGANESGHSVLGYDFGATPVLNRGGGRGATSFIAVNQLFDMDDAIAAGGVSFVLHARNFGVAPTDDTFFHATITGDVIYKRDGGDGFGCEHVGYQWPNSPAFTAAGAPLKGVYFGSEIADEMLDTGRLVVYFRRSAVDYGRVTK